MSSRGNHDLITKSRHSSPHSVLQFLWERTRHANVYGCCCYFPSLSHVWLCTLMDCSPPGFPVHTTSESLLRFMFIESVMISNHHFLCHPLLFLPFIFPSIRVFSNELALRIRWPKYWNFSFSNGPSSEYSELISFRIDWFDLAEWTPPTIPILARCYRESRFAKNIVEVLMSPHQNQSN